MRPTPEFIWLRRRHNRYGVERIPVRVLELTIAGRLLVEYQRSNGTICRALVDRVNLEAVAA